MQFFVVCSDQVLDVIAPPYTSDFVQLLMPLIEDEDITGPLRISEEDNSILDFISKYGGNAETQGQSFLIRCLSL